MKDTMVVPKRLQKEYHELCGQLITLDTNSVLDFKQYIEFYESTEERLEEIERQLELNGYWIDRHHILHIKKR